MNIPMLMTSPPTQVIFEIKEATHAHGTSPQIL